MVRLPGITMGLLGVLGAAGLGSGCGDGGGGSMMMVDEKEVTAADVSSGTEYKFVTNRLLLPADRAKFARDLDGDGSKDNKLGDIIGALTAQDLKAQDGVDESVSEGSVILLVSVKTDDATMKSDASVSATVAIGKEMKAQGGADGGVGGPDFSGKGTFMVDTMQPQSTFYGRLASSKFSSNDPVKTKSPATITLKLSLVTGAPPLTLVINGAHVQFSAGKDPTSMADGLLDGEIHGSVKAQDIKTGIIPSVASILTQQIKDDPMSSSSVQISNLFDVGCGEMMKGKKDGTIEICEVEGNSLIKSILSPDIQVWKDGAYAPVPKNKGAVPDSLSLGIGFSGVKASF